MSDLKSRLSHLVSYSSQLVFVGCDSASDQQRYLTDFLTDHGEHAEVSFFTASEQQSAADYRRIICRQLANQQVGSFVRPLKELLSELSQAPGSYYLCVSMADLIPQEFLLELWQWVADVRKSSRNTHINIILFGNSEWAKATREWLPQQDSQSPVLLSTQSVDAVGFDVNALESLMAQKRAFFAGPSLNAQSITRKKWFISSVMTAFAVIFFGLVWWQYPSVLDNLINNVPMRANAADAIPVPIESETKEALIDVNSLEELPVEEPKPTDYLVTTWEIYQASKASTNDLDNSEKVSDSTMDIKRDDLPNNYNTPELNSETQTSAEMAEQRLMDEFLPDQEGDFRVPDIISVEQLDAQLGNDLLSSVPANSISDIPERIIESKDTLETLTEDQADNDPISSVLEKVEALNSNVNGTSNANTDLTDVSQTQALSNQPAQNQNVKVLGTDDYQFDESLLLQLPDDQVVLQISGIKDLNVLNQFLNANQLRQQTWIYQTRRYGGDWFVVLYKDTFTSIDDAMAQVQALPQRVQQAGPFAKRVGQIRDEINLTQQL